MRRSVLNLWFHSEGLECALDNALLMYAGKKTERAIIVAKMEPVGAAPPYVGAWLGNVRALGQSPSQ